MLGSQIPEHSTPVVGVSITVGAAILGWSLDAIPYLQVVSLIVAIIAGVLTALWYWRQIRAHVVAATAVLAAAEIKAKAKIVAEALKEALEKPNPPSQS